jgi:hypothetical protein
VELAPHPRGLSLESCPTPPGLTAQLVQDLGGHLVGARLHQRATRVRQSEPDHGQPDGHHPAASGSAATYALRGPPTPRPPLAACDFASAPLAPRRSIRLAGHQFASQLVSRRHVGRPGRYGQGSKEEPRHDLTPMAADDSPSECRRGGAQRHLRTRLSRRPGGRRRSISREVRPLRAPHPSVQSQAPTCSRRRCAFGHGEQGRRAVLGSGDVSHSCPFQPG